MTICTKPEIIPAIRLPVDFARSARLKLDSPVAFADLLTTANMKSVKRCGIGRLQAIRAVTPWATVRGVDGMYLAVTNDCRLNMMRW